MSAAPDDRELSPSGTLRVVVEQFDKYRDTGVTLEPEGLGTVLDLLLDTANRAQAVERTLIDLMLEARRPHLTVVPGGRP